MPALRYFLQQATSFLVQHKIDSPRLSAELIIAHILGISRLDLLLSLQKHISSSREKEAWSLLAERAKGCPVAYLLHRKEFYALDFELTSDVLVPRPESELIVDLVQDIFAPEDNFCFADIGTGCGAVGLALLSVFPFSSAVLSDISPGAVRLTLRNAIRHNMQQRVLGIMDNLGSALRPASLDLAVANPPYLSSADFKELSPEVRNYEPEIALWGGPHGHEKTLQLAISLLPAMKPGARIIMESAPEQVRLLQKSWQALGFKKKNLGVYKDLAGKERIIDLYCC